MSAEESEAKRQQLTHTVGSSDSDSLQSRLTAVNSALSRELQCMNFLQQVNANRSNYEALYNLQFNVSRLDISFVSYDGLPVWPALLYACQHGLKYVPVRPEQAKLIVAKLLEYRRPQTDAQTGSSSAAAVSASPPAAQGAAASAPALFVPADADELLHHFAVELTPFTSMDVLHPNNVLLELILTLHRRGCDFDRRNQQGRSLLHAVAQHARWPLLQMMLLGHTHPPQNAGMPAMADILEPWMRDSEGQTAADIAASTPDGAASAAMLRQVEHHWRTKRRPLMMEMLTAALIPDVAQLALSYASHLASLALLVSCMPAGCTPRASAPAAAYNASSSA